MSDVELNRVQRYGGTRLVVFAYSVRVLGIAAGACAAVLGVFGFMSLAGGTAAQDNLPSTNELYMGVNLLWLIALGLLVVMGEIRVGWVKKSVLKPFGFMHTYVGRGNFYLFYGSVVVSSGQANSFALAEGIVLLVIGVIQLLMAFFMSKKPKRPSALDRAGATSDASVENPILTQSHSQRATTKAKPYETVASPGTKGGASAATPAGPGGPSSSADFESGTAATASLGATGKGKQFTTDGDAATENPFLKG
ncbi:hypothetical protein FNF31_01522 [Cafeteria roenbergensis]|uniref:Uncharacterized protein n=1 Tax=Cafeteria roenbergensis TaxID=33653 RepID=A0A5A8DRW6_CAFRO|nr:hypothetical protein FNF31_01522 [Cafeteria roenbergensis]KAA0168176.1 hypothetical protein FNF28_02595 [Cafeteria roenbergensis]